MGALAGVLGHAAAGFEQARQEDLQRQFADEQNRRAQISGFLQKVAGDESAHQYSRQASINELLKLSQTPWNKTYKFDPNSLVAPVESQTPVRFNAPPQPPLQLGLTQIPAPPASVQLQSQPGIYMSPEQHTQFMAQRVGQITGAQASQEAGPPIMQIGPNGEMTTVIPSKQPNQKFENTFSPLLGRMMSASMHPVTVLDAQGQAQPAFQDKLGMFGPRGAVYGQDGQVIPNARVFESSLMGHTQTETMAPSGAITRTSKPSPNVPTAGAARSPISALPTLPTPPAGVVGVIPQGSLAPEQAPTESTPAPTAAPAAKSKSKASGGVARSSQLPMQLPRTAEDWQKIHDPVTLDAIDWATQGRKPTGGPMAERQVRARMAQMGLAPAMPIPPAMQMKVQELFVARNSAIDLIDDIMANKKVLDSALAAGKIAISSDPEGNGILSRAANLNAQEARVAGDFQQLIEHANLLRGPLGATGFRGQEAWGALQAQRGKPLADPRITAQVMTGMRSRLVGLNNADKLVLGGQGMNAAAADPYEGRIAIGPNKERIRWTNGQWVDANTGAAIQ